MRVSIVNQPYADGLRLYDFLTSLLGSPAIEQFTAITAWTNHRGLSRIVPALRAFRGRGGHAAIVLGIDEGGATAQGLRLAVAEFDDAWVFHSNDARTFHHKAYVGRGTKEARMLFGSTNLTPGGLFHNYEGGLVIDLELAIPDDAALLGQVDQMLAGLLSDSRICRRLAPDVERIIRDPAFRIRDESEPRRAWAGKPIDPDADSRDPALRPLFGRSTVPLSPAVPPGEPIALMTTPKRRARRASAASPRPTSRLPASGVAIAKRWYRPMDGTAAQHPPTPRSNPTGKLNLTQARHDIDHLTYFRYDFFGAASWSPTAMARGTREVAVVPIEVVLDGLVVGTSEFELSHASWREEGQGNVPTVLHWGSLTETLHAVDYSGRIVTLERFSDGRFRLTIDIAETGPFIP